MQENLPKEAAVRGGRGINKMAIMFLLLLVMSESVFGNQEETNCPKMYIPNELEDATKLRQTNLVRNLLYKNPPTGNAMRWAGMNGDVELIDLFLRNGALVNGRGYDCETALFGACSRGQTEAVAYLINRKADVNLKNVFGTSPLIASVKFPEIVDLLIKNAAKIDEIDKDGATALMWACFYRNSDTVRLLLAKGANVSIKRKGEEYTYTQVDGRIDVGRTKFENWTAFDFARVFGGGEILNLLEEHNKKWWQFWR